MGIQRFLAASAALLVSGCVIQVAPPTSASSPAPTNDTERPSAYGATEARIFDLINAERQHQGKLQATNMARLHKMAHTLPESATPTLGSRASFVGYPFGRLTENVALGYPNAPTVVQGWMNSSGHRHNILDAGVVETGIGIARGSDGSLYYCQVFGKQLTSL